MDEINQIQNPNVAPTQGAGGQTSMPGMPVMSMKKKSQWFWITLVIIVAIGGLAWWYVSQMGSEIPFVQQPQIDQGAREDAMISGDVQDADSTNVDAEFQNIDKDLNSL